MNGQPEQALVGPAEKALLRVLKLYQELISPALGRRCRYLPTCSAYAKTAIERFGAWKEPFWEVVGCCVASPLDRAVLIRFLRRSMEWNRARSLVDFVGLDQRGARLGFCCLI